MTRVSRRRITAMFVLYAGMIVSTHAAAPLQQSAHAIPSSTQITIKSDLSIDQMSQLICPQGVERFLPGSYYYCVGLRDVALGKNDQARSMLDLAARWGSKPAEFLLGIGYFKGDLQPLDRARGLAWLGLSSERQDPSYLAIFASAWKQATPQERANAQLLWSSMLPIYGDQKAARRAASRFKHERDALLGPRQTNGAMPCITGLNTGMITPVTGTSEDQSTGCYGAEMSPDLIAKRLDVYAGQLFNGWSGHVTVGELKPVPAPSN